MGKKDRKIGLLQVDLADVEAENETLRDELAHAINRNIQLGKENDRLNDTIAELETVIVNLNRAVFGIGATKSVDSADWPS